MGGAASTASAAHKYVDDVRKTFRKLDPEGRIKKHKKKKKKKKRSPSQDSGDGQHLDLQDVIRDQVAAMAERNAGLRQAEHPKMTPAELRGLKNKERIIEEMRIREISLELATTFSITIKWELLYQETEGQIQFFVVQMMPMMPQGERFECWSSLEGSPDERCVIAAPGGEWTELPQEAIDRAKRTVYLGGLDDNTPGLVFRVRGRHSVGWGHWSAPNEAYRPVSPTLPPPFVEQDPDEPYQAQVSLPPTMNVQSFGQVLYHRVLVRWCKGPSAIPPGFLYGEGNLVEVYNGRESEFVVGCSSAKVTSGSFGGTARPLVPGHQYSVVVERAVGLSRGDRRYNSYFASAERVFVAPCTVPMPPQFNQAPVATSKTLELTWQPPLHDGGSMILAYKVMGRMRPEFGGDTVEKEYYSGTGTSCLFGAGLEEGVLEPDAMEIAPGCTFGFRLVAVNEHGQGQATPLVWCRTKTLEEEEAERTAELSAEMHDLEEDIQSATYEFEEELMASPDAMVDLPDGWKEYWDPNTKELFYYNVYTGQNQWEHPGQAHNPALGTETEEDRMWRFFRKKRFRFLHDLHQAAKGRLGGDTTPLRVSVRREQLVADSVYKLQRLDVIDLFRKLHIIYEGETGIDSGGLSKDWFLEVSRGLLLPDYGLFQLAEDAGVYMLDPRSAGDPSSGAHLRAFGRICGKALYDQQLLNAPLCSGLLKQMCGEKPQLSDLRQVDHVLANSLQWMLDNDITDVLEETFSVMVEEFGNYREVELCERGARRKVTERNKSAYVDALVRWRFAGSVQQQLQCFLEGVWSVCSAEQLSRFMPDELSMLLNGKPGIDVDELRSGCVKYTGGFDEDSVPVAVFWQVMYEFGDEDREQVLRFATGCGKMPLDGFPPFLPFTITKSEFGVGALPSAHTCFNQLVLPPYEDAEAMRAKLLIACAHGVGFEMS